MGKIKILGIAIISTLLLGGGPIVTALAQAEVPVSINAPDRVMPGSDFTATVDIGEVADLNAAQYEVSFDNTVLRLDDVTPGQIDSTEIPVMSSEISPGTYRVVNSLGLEAVSGSGYLAVLHFHALQAGQSDINLSEGLLSSMEATPIPAIWTGDSVHVAPEIIAILVEPTSVDFGSVTPGLPSAPQTVTVTNIGNVAENFSASIENESPPGVYSGTPGLTINGSSVSAWGVSDVAAGSFIEAELILTVPSGTAPGTYKATLVFWAEKSS